MTAVNTQSLEDTSLKQAPKESKTGSLNKYTFEILDTEGVTKAVYEFLTKANEVKVQTEFEAVEITQMLADTDFELARMKVELESVKPSFDETMQEEKARFEQPESGGYLKEPMPHVFKQSPKAPAKAESHPDTQKTIESSALEQLAHSRANIFGQRNALAQMLRANTSDKAPFFMVAPGSHNESSERQTANSEIVRQPELENGPKRSESQEQEREGSGREQQRDPQEEKKRQNKKLIIERKNASVASSERGENREPPDTLRDIGDIFTRFLALMARILGQAEADAHNLYQRIKERTDNIDILTGLIGKINTSDGKIDWSKDEQMKAIIDKVRALGVEIPEGKYSWTDEEKRYLKENIQMRKDTLEKVTQLERTDMQRYMQEASQCHQARSNVLKLIKEVMDTIIHNMRA